MDNAKRARIRSGDAAVNRIARAASRINGAVVSEALEGPLSSEHATGLYRAAETDLHGALALIHDCRRSIEGIPVKDEEGEREERMLQYLARMEHAIEEFLKAEVAGTPRDGLPFHRLDEARLLPPDLLAAVRRRQEAM